ncbi:MAG: mechanosensitive ion channel family protein [Methanobacteriaceae archaeon]
MIDILESYITPIIYSILTLIIARALVFIFNNIFKRSIKNLNLDPTIIHLVTDTVKYIIYILAIVMVLELFGVNVSGLVVSLGIVGIAIGFASRDILSNFISGIFVISDKTVKVGEVIKVNDYKGKVIKVGLRTTTIITESNKTVTIPNSVLSKTPYINYTYRNCAEVDFDGFPVKLEFTVPTTTNIDLFRENSLKGLSAMGWSLKNPGITINIVNIDSEGINLRVTAWTENYSKTKKYRNEMAEIIRKNIVET